MREPDAMEADKGLGAIGEAAPPTQSCEDQISLLSCPAPREIKNSLSSAQTPPLVQLKGAVMPYSFHFYQAGDNLHNAIFSSTTSKTSVDFETLVHYSSLYVALHFHHFMRQTVLF